MFCCPGFSWHLSAFDSQETVVIRCSISHCTATLFAIIETTWFRSAFIVVTPLVQTRSLLFALHKIFLKCCIEKFCIFMKKVRVESQSGRSLLKTDSPCSKKWARSTNKSGRSNIKLDGGNFKLQRSRKGRSNNSNLSGLFEWFVGPSIFICSNRSLSHELIFSWIFANLRNEIPKKFQNPQELQNDLFKIQKFQKCQKFQFQMSKSQCEIIIINQDHLQIDFKIIALKSQFHDFTKKIGNC